MSNLTLNDSEEAVGSEQNNPLKPKQQQHSSFNSQQKKPEQQSIKPQHKLSFFKRLLLFSLFKKKGIEFNSKKHFCNVIGYLSISIVKYSILIGLKTCISILFFLNILTLIFLCANISYCWWKHPLNPMKFQYLNHGNMFVFLIKTIKKKKQPLHR